MNSPRISQRRFSRFENEKRATQISNEIAANEAARKEYAAARDAAIKALDRANKYQFELRKLAWKSNNPQLIAAAARASEAHLQLLISCKKQGYLRNPNPQPIPGRTVKNPDGFKI